MSGPVRSYIDPTLIDPRFRQPKTEEVTGMDTITTIDAKATQRLVEAREALGQGVGSDPHGNEAPEPSPYTPGGIQPEKEDIGVITDNKDMYKDAVDYTTKPSFSKESLEAAIREGLTEAQIKERFGVTSYAVKNAKAQWGLAGLARTAKVKHDLTPEKLKALLAEGLSNAEIGRRYGVDATLVSYYRQKWGMGGGKGRPKEVEVVATHDSQLVKPTGLEMDASGYVALMPAETRLVEQMHDLLVMYTKMITGIEVQIDGLEKQRAALLNKRDAANAWLASQEQVGRLHA